VDRLEILVQVAVAFGAARLLGASLERIGIPSIVGQILAGILVGPSVLGIVEHSALLEALAELGVVVLLFLAGLETHLQSLFRSWVPAVRVGSLGIILPFAAGLATGYLFGYQLTDNLFIGTALVATSVGITVSVLRQLGYSERYSMNIVLGAAVLDDILGLIILALVQSIAIGSFQVLQFILLIIEASAFLALTVYAGPKVIERIQTTIRRLPEQLVTDMAFVLMLGLALLAQWIGLAAIVGAFVAGLMLAKVRHFAPLERTFEPVAYFLVPFFFINVGSFLEPGIFLQPRALAQIALFTALAVASKFLGAYFGARAEGKQIAAEVGVAMVPRGEVGIVVASIALSAGAIDNDLYGVVVAVVILTTVAAPFLIRWIYERTPVNEHPGSRGVATENSVEG